jgi:predicted XRE-type DNA-binding protein
MSLATSDLPNCDARRLATRDLPDCDARRLAVRDRLAAYYNQQITNGLKPKEISEQVGISYNRLMVWKCNTRPENLVALIHLEAMEKRLDDLEAGKRTNLSLVPTKVVMDGKSGLVIKKEPDVIVEMISKLAEKRGNILDQVGIREAEIAAIVEARQKQVSAIEKDIEHLIQEDDKYVKAIAALRELREEDR